MGLNEDLEAWGRALDEISGQKRGKGKRVSVPNSIKNEVKYRQHYRCYNCDRPLPPTAHIHHKIHLSDGGKNTLDNLIALCPNCHAEHHHREQLKDANRKQRGGDYGDDEQDDEGNVGADMLDRLNKFGEDL